MTRLSLLLLALCWACADAVPDAMEPSDASYVELGDVDRLRVRGRVRLANVARAQVEELPRLRWGMPSEDHLAREFAERLGVELVIRDYPGEEAARSALLDGHVDGIVGRSGPGIAPPPAGIAYSAPFTEMTGVLVARRGASPASVDELAGRRLALASSSALVGLADSLRSVVPGLSIDTLDVATVEDVVDRILDGTEDVTLAERWVAEALAAVEPALEIGASFGEIRYTAAVRASNPDLLRLVNDFAFEVRAVGTGGAEALGDLEAIRERGVLRVLTVNGPSSYYLYRGDVVGFDYDLVRRFADAQDLLLRMVVVPSAELLETWLARGLGDMIGVGVVGSAMRGPAATRLTRPYHAVHPVVIAPAELGVAPTEGYAGRSVVAARNNPYLPVLRGLRDSLGFQLRVTSDAESTGQLLDRLERGEAELTVLESHLADLELPDHPDLAVVDSVTDVPGLSWAVRADQPALLAALDDFFAQEVGGLTYAVLLRKHFGRETRRVIQPDLRPDGSLSPWDDIVRRHAEEVGLDWRVLTAQMFQESRFDPTATSAVGAYGLMQMMPATARQMGVEALDQPEAQIRAGIRYMGWLWRRFDAELPFLDRMAFTLAAYNAGYGHVSDARRVAESAGDDPDRWFDSVERAMLSLSDPDVYAGTRHGYVRGREPVLYVRRVNELGQMYYRLAPGTGGDAGGAGVDGGVGRN